MEDKEEVTMTFGLTAKNMEVIEKHIGKWDGAVFDRRTWEKIGDEIGWDHLTAALWYFRKLGRNREKEAENAIAREIEDKSVIAKHIESIDFLDAVAGNCDYISEEADKLESAIRRLAGLEVSNV